MAEPHEVPDHTPGYGEVMPASEPAGDLGTTLPADADGETLPGRHAADPAAWQPGRAADPIGQFQPEAVAAVAPHPWVQPSATGRLRPMLVTSAMVALAAGLVGGVGGAAALQSAGRDQVVTIAQSAAIPAAADAAEIEQAAAAISPSVVTLAVTAGPDRNDVADTGTGIIMSTDGYILTNNHVIAAAADKGTVTAALSDGTTHAATIVGRDQTSDLAVIRIKVGGPLRPAVFTDSARATVGQQVVAVGAPLGLTNTVTSGIISATGRPVATSGDENRVATVFDALQTDAAINPGNSGGPLADLAGHVLGVNTAIATAPGAQGSAGGNIGVGFAIPSNLAVTIARQLIEQGRAVHPQIGIMVQTADRGAEVDKVNAQGPAQRAGLVKGDVITALDGRRIPNAETLVAATRGHHVGDQVTVTYLRDGLEGRAHVTLGADAGQ